MDKFKEELDFTLDILIKSAFYSESEILEILEEQFMDEDFNFNELDFSLKNADNINFNKLEEVFNQLASKNIIAIHNCGYDVDDGINDVFELYQHLKNNNLNPKGFVFYSFEDVEEAILENQLFLTFADFSENKANALKIGEIITELLEKHDFKVIWNHTVEEFIVIDSFKWDKSFNTNTYEIEGAFETFKSLN